MSEQREERREGQQEEEHENEQEQQKKDGACACSGKPDKFVAVEIGLSVKCQNSGCMGGLVRYGIFRSDELRPREYICGVCLARFYTVCNKVSGSGNTRNVHKNFF